MNQINQIPIIANPSGVPIMFQSPGGIMPINTSQNIPINYPINNNIMGQIPQSMQPFIGINQMNEEYDDDEDDEPDPILDDDTTDLNTINPLILMENTALIVKKNLVEKKWFLMRGEKILGNYNSEQLLYFLTSQIQQGNKFEDMSINDHTTDLHFKPSMLYDILNKYVPKLKKIYIKKVLEQNNELMRKMQQQQQQQMIRINQLKQMQMMKINNQINQMKINQMNNNNNINNNNNFQESRNINNRNNNQFNNNHGYNNYNNYNYNRHYNNNHGYNNMNYNQYYQGNYMNPNKKPHGKY